MPRPRKPELEGKEVKKRSRNGCWPCKSRKVKCGEEKPSCQNCERQGETCDYSIRLNWDGRTKKKDDGKPGSQIMSFSPTPPTGSKRGPPSPDLNGHTPRAGVSPMPSHSPPQPMPVMQEQMPMQNYGNNLSLPHSDFQQSMQPAPPVLRAPSWGESRNNGNFQSMPQIRQHSPYPSPQESGGFTSPGLNGGMYNPGAYSNQMPPPMPTSNPYALGEAISSPYNGAKRVRLSPQTETFGSGQYHRNGFDMATPSFFPPSYSLANPLTPAASISQDNDDRRISVSSLLSDDPGPPTSKRPSASDQSNQSGPTSEPSVPLRRGSLHQRMISYSETELYGHDRGMPDFDIPRNNDTTAISANSPSEHSDFGTWLEAEFEDASFGFGTASRETVFASGGYYASPVPIKIPRKLEPLPPTLTENPMNLLYFHHFLNHTARILVPHDCPENPFKTILPKMAVEDPNLLNLMLAYSACHRARLLNHPEPANRIALWVRDVFPALRKTLESSSEDVENANLALAIMLASLEIISPSSFGVSIPWQDHLSIARAIIRSRGGPHSISRKDPVMYFLTRWLAYLDVLGSLSGRRNEEPLFAGNYWSSSHDDGTSTKELSLDDEDGDDEDDYTIDCLLGFTTRCVSILAQIALLARECEPERLDPSTNRVNQDWRPGPEVLKRAEKLRRDLEHARTHEQHQCAHHSPTMPKAQLIQPAGHVPPERRYSYVHMTDQDAEESLATNSAFHWAGMIHLLRRVHNLPRSHPEVQDAVHEIVKVLSRIRERGSAEACLLFPTFTAGVEAEKEVDRAEVLARIKGAEGLGMCQVNRARKVMEEVWRTGESWESLVTNEFFG